MLWNYPLPEILVMGFFLIGISVILAWIVDSIIESVGYGIFGNAFFIFLGVIAGSMCLNIYGYELDQFPVFSLITVTSICFGLFLTTLILKKAMN